ncbi:hypothetical protein [Chondrinema litorale]|uniref:hypothetical protein n=1 Tax=Chondrinema litorale TaxID=2994555 RepID=UPI002543E36B|nr:hypothetical protein [Chondrinema litorale]UZR98529.1 hypothetical protein OQ292_31495 [Chondrinema litorale]
MEETKLKLLILLNCLLLVGSLVFAHPLPSTKVHLQINGKRIIGTAIMPTNELDLATKRKIDLDNLNDEFLINYFKKHIQINSQSQTWEVIIKSFESFEENDQAHGGHHGIIPFLLVHFEIQPSNGNVLEPFIFNFDVITHEVVTHDVDVFQLFNNRNKTKENKLGRITLDIKKETFNQLEIQLQDEYQKNNVWWIFLLVGVIIIIAIILIIKTNKKF